MSEHRLSDEFKFGVYCIRTPAPFAVCVCVCVCVWSTYYPQILGAKVLLFFQLCKKKSYFFRQSTIFLV